ncbi:MAG: tetratricopeptide repeat protein [Lachnospiraceae bacterium]|nr:tetratricopeptide repeat protein [Lachnospiraceae bacterium]
MFCKNCGVKNDDDAKFCIACGGPTGIVPVQTGIPQGENSAGVKPKKKKDKLPFIIAGAVLLVGIATFLIIFLSSASPEAKARKELKLANQYLDEMQYEMAIASYTKAIEIDPKNVEAYEGLANTYIAMAEEAYTAGDVDLAITYNEKAVEILAQGERETENQKLATLRRDIEEKYLVAEERTDNTAISEVEMDAEENPDANQPAVSDYVDPEETQAYVQILQNALYYGEMNGNQYGDPSYAEGWFSIYDIDNDGRKELLLCWQGDCMANYASYIWGYADGKTHVELTEFPAYTFYDNGIIEVGISHNQGLAGSFWPYTTYKYNENTDTFDYLCFMDAWDRNWNDTDFNGEKFPAEFDEDGDGLIYYMYSGDWSNPTKLGPVDFYVYESWRNDYLNGAHEIEIPFTVLNEENIENLLKDI